MTRLRFVSALTVLLANALTASAQTIPNDVGKASSSLPSALQNVGFEPQLNTQVPLNPIFRDEMGREVRLGQYFGRKPVLLALVYYSCPMLCEQVQLGVVGALKMLSFTPGRDYEVIFVSFDPHDTPQLAAQKKEAALSHYRRPETASGWHFLSGSPESVETVAKAVNFRYSFDWESKLFAHASGIMLLTPEGHVSRYFYGVEYPARDVRLGLIDASAGKIGTPIDHLLLFCFQYNPHTARYSAAILKVVRVAGLLTIFTIVAGIAIFRRRDLLVLPRNLIRVTPVSSEKGAH